MPSPTDDDTCPPETLAMLYRVLDESLNTIGDGDQLRSDWRDELRIRLAEVIMAEFEKGARDPHLLRRMALTSVALDYIGKTGSH